jgi:MFS family permease
MVSELTMDHLPHQRARAFSLLPLMYGLGSIIGPMLGGFLSHPVTNLPFVFGNLGVVTDFLELYPYFLPCAISAFICTLGLVFGYFFLEETHPVHKKQVVDEEERLLVNKKGNKQQQGQNYSTFNDDNQDQDERSSQHSPTPTIHDKHTPPTLKESITPSVLAICITYAFFAFQAIFMDGNFYMIYPFYVHTNLCY